MELLCEDSCKQITENVFKVYRNRKIQDQVTGSLRNLCQQVIRQLHNKSALPDVLSQQIKFVYQELDEKNASLLQLNQNVQELEDAVKKLTQQNQFISGQLVRRVDAWNGQRKRYITEIIRLKQQLWLYQNRLKHGKDGDGAGWSEALANDPFLNMDLTELCQDIELEEFKCVEESNFGKDGNITWKDQLRANLQLLQYKLRVTTRQSAEHIQGLLQSFDSDRQQLGMKITDQEAVIRMLTQQLSCLRKQLRVRSDEVVSETLNQVTTTHLTAAGNVQSPSSCQPSSTMTSPNQGCSQLDTKVPSPPDSQADLPSSGTVARHLSPSPTSPVSLWQGRITEWVESTTPAIASLAEGGGRAVGSLCRPYRASSPRLPPTAHPRVADSGTQTLDAAATTAQEAGTEAQRDLILVRHCSTNTASASVVEAGVQCTGVEEEDSSSTSSPWALSVDMSAIVLEDEQQPPPQLKLPAPRSSKPSSTTPTADLKQDLQENLPPQQSCGQSQLLSSMLHAFFHRKVKQGGAQAEGGGKTTRDVPNDNEKARVALAECPANVAVPAKPPMPTAHSDCGSQHSLGAPSSVAAAANYVRVPYHDIPMWTASSSSRGGGTQLEVTLSHCRPPASSAALLPSAGGVALVSVRPAGMATVDPHSHKHTGVKSAVTAAGKRQERTTPKRPSSLPVATETVLATTAASHLAVTRRRPGSLRVPTPSSGCRQCVTEGIRPAVIHHHHHAEVDEEAEPKVPRLKLLQPSAAATATPDESPAEASPGEIEQGAVPHSARALDQIIALSTSVR